MKLFRFLPGLAAVWGALLFGYLYGYLTIEPGWFPARNVKAALEPAHKIGAALIGHISVPYARTTETRAVSVIVPQAMAAGMTLITGIGKGDRPFAAVVAADGTVLHHWDLDWFTLWPHPTHLSEDDRPKQRPGAHVHGALLSSNGDLTFNYENLGTVQVDICDQVKWRLARRTNHSLSLDGDGNLWVWESRVRETRRPDLPIYRPPFNEYSILKVSPQGQVLREIDPVELLRRNGYEGLLHLGTVANDAPYVSGDTLHPNDVEVFPSTLAPGLFKAGDIMISLRNINTVMVFDPATLVVKTAIVGRFVRQHDPNFIDGQTISVFDNNNVGQTDPARQSSKIVRYSVADGRATTVFEGTAQHPFYSYIMGKHQWLPNGGLLVAEAVKGRALEIDRSGRVVWTYNNILRPGIAGLLEQATRLAPSFMTPDRLSQLAARCPKEPTR